MEATSSAQRPSSHAKDEKSAADITKEFARLLNKGTADVLDEDDLYIHLPAEHAKFLVKTSESLRKVKVAEERLKHKVVECDVTFNVSINDLLKFNCTRTEAAKQGAEASSCVLRPFALNPENITASKPENWYTETHVLPVGATVQITQDEFRNLLADDVKFGDSLSERYLEIHQHIEKTVPVQDYLASKFQNLLTFGATSKFTGTPVSIIPTLHKDELNRLVTTSFLTKELVEKGVLKYQIGDMNYYYIPEEHGLAQFFKTCAQSVVGTIRFFTLTLTSDPSRPKNYLRLAEPSYKDLLSLLFKRELNPELDRVFDLKDFTCWVGYKIPGEVWTVDGEKEKLEALGTEALNAKHKVTAKIRMALLMLNPDLYEDWFWGREETYSQYVPGMSFLDGVVHCELPVSEEQRKERHLPENTSAQTFLTTINGRALPHYLKENLPLRRKIKEGISVEPRQSKSYKEKLLAP